MERNKSGRFTKGHKGYKTKPWLGQKLSKKHRENISKGLKGKTKSKEHIAKLSGENHWNWKGGKTSYINRMRRKYHKEFHEWKLKVLKRDDFTCKTCGRNDVEVFAHHIIPMTKDNIELWFDVDNGLTVCRSCHKKLHPEIGLETRFK